MVWHKDRMTERQKDRKTERQKGRKTEDFDVLTGKKWLNEKDRKTFFEKYTDYMQKVK